MSPTAVPDRTEAAEYYFTYINQVPAGDIIDILDRQTLVAMELLERIPADRSSHRYEPGKWTIQEVVSHVNDCERMFCFRAFWFARGFDTPLPSFDQNVAIAGAAPDGRSWQSHVDEFPVVRAATLEFFRHLPPAAWTRRGIASDNPFTVRALAYIVAGHVFHHMRILRERYLS